RVDEASILTIHGFAQHAVKENAFESALPFDRGEQVDDGAVFEEVTGDYWRRQVMGKHADPGFLQLWPNPGTLDGALKPFRTKPHARIEGPNHREMEQLAAGLRKNWKSKSGKNFDEQVKICWENDAFKKEWLKKRIRAWGGPEEALAAIEAALPSNRSIPVLPDWTAHLQDPDLQFKKAEAKNALGQDLLKLPVARELLQLHHMARLASLRAARHEVEDMAA